MATLTFTVASYLADSANWPYSPSDFVQIIDTSTNIDNMTAGQITGLGTNNVDKIDSSNNLISWNVAQWQAVPTGLGFDINDLKIVADTGANIDGLTATDLGHFNTYGVTEINPTTDVTAFSAADYAALGGISFDQSANVTLSDTAANIEALSTAQFGAMAVKGIDHIDATDNVLSLTVGQALHLGSVTLDGSDTVTLADTGAHLASLSVDQITALGEAGVSIIDATDNVLNITVAQGFAGFEAGMNLTPSDFVTVVDTGADISAVSASDMANLGEDGFDKIDATDNAYSLSVAQGLALGGSGVLSAANDVITVADTGGNLGEMSIGDISVLGGYGVDKIDATDNAVSFTVAQVQAIDGWEIGLTASDTVTISDTTAHINALTSSDYSAFAGNHVDIIDSSDNVAYNVDAASAAIVVDHGMQFAADDTVTLADTGANIQALTAVEFGELAAAGVDRINATDDALALTVAQYDALGSVALTGSDTVTIRDSGANLDTLDFSSLAAKGVDALDATDNVLSLTAQQFIDLGSVSLAAGDVVTLADTGANIAALTDTQLISLGGKGVDVIDATDNKLSLTVNQFSELGSVALTLADVVTISDTAGHIDAITTGQLATMNADGVDILDVSNHKGVLFDAAQVNALGSVVFAAHDDVTLFDTGVNISGIAGPAGPTPPGVDFSKLAAEGIDHIDASDDTLFLSAAQYGELGTVTLTQSDYVTEYDTGADIAAQSLSTLAGLYAAGVDQIDASDNVLNLSVAQFEALNVATGGKTGPIHTNFDPGSILLTQSDTVTLLDTGTNLASLTAAQMLALGEQGVDFLDATDNQLTLSASQYGALGEAGVGLTGSDYVTLTGTGGQLAHLDFSTFSENGVDHIDATDNVLNLTKNQVDALATAGTTLTPNDVVTMRAGESVLEALTPTQIAGYEAQGVDIISSTTGTLNLTAAQTAAVVNTGLHVDDANNTTIVDTGAHVSASLGALYGSLQGAGIDHIDLTDNTINLTVAQALTLDSTTVQFDTSDNAVTILDTASAIEALTGAQLTALGTGAEPPRGPLVPQLGLGVDIIDSTDGTLAVNADQVSGAYAGSISFAESNVVTLADTNANLTAGGSDFFFEAGASGVDHIDATDNKLFLTVEDLRAIEDWDMTLTAADHVTLVDTGADLADMSVTEINALNSELVDQLRLTDGMASLKLNQFAAFESHGFTFASTDTITVTGAGGSNLYQGGVEHDVLIGNGANDTLNGGQGSDTLVAGGSGDQMSGGGGVDTFVFTNLSFSPVGAEDRILDLQNADIIDLSKIDANSLVSGNQAFEIVSKFDGHAGEMVIKYNAGSNTTILKMDTNGDGVADGQIIINGDHHDFNNFVL